MQIFIMPPHLLQINEGQGIFRHLGFIAQIGQPQRFIAARVDAHLVVVQGLEAVDGLNHVLRQVTLGSGG